MTEDTNPTSEQETAKISNTQNEGGGNVVGGDMNTAGRDILIAGPGATIVVQSTSSDERSSEKLKKAKERIKHRDFGGAQALLRELLDNETLSPDARCWFALALLAGRRTNVIPHSEREMAESYLRSALNQRPEWLFPLAILAILEMDYYNYHGRSSKNDIELDEVAEKLRGSRLPPEEHQLLQLLGDSLQAKERLGLDW